MVSNLSNGNGLRGKLASLAAAATLAAAGTAVLNNGSDAKVISGNEIRQELSGDKASLVITDLP